MIAPEQPEPPSRSTEESSDGSFVKALTRTMAVVGAVGILVAATTFLLDRLGGPGPAANRPLAADSPAVRAAIPEAYFRDITSSAGIRFTHVNGAYGEKLLPETMGGGVAFLDFDNDGDPDLLLVNGSEWPWQEPSETPLPTHALYRNRGDGTFEDATPGSGLDFACYGMGVAVGDYDDDGWVDVFLTAVGGNHLLRNNAGRGFVDVTATAGVGGAPEDWSTSAAWFDFDHDNDLDLFVGNYLRWSREIDLQADFQLPGIGRAYGQPWNFPATFPYLYRNDGQGRFTDVSATSGIQVVNRATGQPLAKSLGVRPVDIDNDGWLDLIVANDTVPNFVFHNERNGTFREIGAEAGIAFDSFGATRGAMGIDTARFDAQDALGVSIGNFANEMTAIYVARDNTMVFTDEAIAQGVGDASRMALTFGVFFFDYDLDGWLDLLTANGHIENEIEKVQPTQRYRQTAQLFWNANGLPNTRGFVPVPEARAGPDLFRPLVGRGSAYADIDADGDLDVVIAQIGGPPRLLRNEQQLHHHWLRLKLVGPKGNRDAIGARVRARIGPHVRVREVMPTRGYLSQSELPVTLGLGTATQVDELTVLWPEGPQRVDQPMLDGLTVVVQGR